jgi:3-methyl-2-oxobutanoate hydroxymethyltransferase
MSESPKPVTVTEILNRKKAGEKIAMLTAYDALFGRLVDQEGIDIVLVGDSVNTVLAGRETTLSATLDQMIYHGRSVRAGVKRAMVIVDMPFLTFQVSLEDTKRNAGWVMQETGAAGVKLEGGKSMAPTVRALVEMGVPVMGHIGFTPQSVHALGGYRVQGRGEEAAAKLIEDARALQDAGAFSIVLELIPSEVARRITEAIDIPTIGIGSGPHCDGQVLVLHDMLGLNEEFNAKFVKRYANLAEEVRRAVRRFRDEVRAGQYPDRAHSFEE